MFNTSLFLFLPQEQPLESPAAAGAAAATQHAAGVQAACTPQLISPSS